MPRAIVLVLVHGGDTALSEKELAQKCQAVLRDAGDISAQTGKGGKDRIACLEDQSVDDGGRRRVEGRNGRADESKDEASQ